ncbi:MAG TPA: hypothetical protein VNA89_16185 [Gemmatimonadaceae bacterium]|nr:hypothetical protein [Gemmatimonadaceae bacterium]
MTILPRSVNADCRDYRLRRNDLPAASSIVRTLSRRGRPLALLAAGLLALPAAAAAQVAEGPGETALGAPRGTIRVSVLADLTQWTDRFDPSGERESAVIDFNAPFGPLQFPLLRPIETDLRTATGRPDFALTVGTLGVSADARVTRVPILLEAGFTNWLSLSFLLPVVRTRYEVYLRPNPAGTEGNVSVNPFLATPHSGVNEQVQTELLGARSALRALIDQCAANPGASPQCPTINADRPRAEQLYALSGALADALARTYGGRADVDAAAYVPVAGSAPHTAVVSRLDSVSTAFAAYLGGAPPVAARPQAAFGQLTLPEARDILEDEYFSFVRSGSLERQGLGDVEAGVKLLLLDSFRGAGKSRFDPSGVNLRLAVGGAFRAATRLGDVRPGLFDLLTSDGQNDVEARVWADVLFGRRAWATIAGRYTWQLPDEESVRIRDAPDLVFPAAYRERVVDRDLGDYYEVEVTPRFALGRALTLAGHYQFRRKAADSHRGQFVVPASETDEGADVVLDASTLDAETEVTLQRVGLGFSYSNAANYTRRRARFPVEVSYLHLETIAGEGGNVPRARSDRIQLRFYTRLFGSGPLVR